MRKCFKLSFSTRRASFGKVGVAEKSQTVRLGVHVDNSRQDKETIGMNLT